MAGITIQSCELLSTALTTGRALTATQSSGSPRAAVSIPLVRGQRIAGASPLEQGGATAAARKKGSSQITTRSNSSITFARLVKDAVPNSALEADAPFDFKSYIGTKARTVQFALDKAVPLQYPEAVTEAMRYSLLAGGKRLRPTLCIAACELVGGTEEDAMATACAIEMIHTMSLIHDDLPSVDNDDMRRGMPSCHKKFGENVALWAGDALLSQAFEHIARCTPPSVAAEKTVRVIAFLGKCTGAEGVVGGQIVDMFSEGDPKVLLDTLEYIHMRKTAALLESCVVCGAILGGAADDEVESLSKYARSVGLLFQVVDDIWEVTQKSEQLGETTSAGKDLLTEKATYPKLLGMEGARQLAADLSNKAKEHLSIFDPQKAAPLYGFADFITRRAN